MADLFGCEEKVVKMFGMLDDDMRRHFDDHDRILDSYSRIYFEFMRHKMNETSMTEDVCKLLSTEVIIHTHNFDVKLGQCIKRCVEFTRGEVYQLEFV